MSTSLRPLGEFTAEELKRLPRDKTVVWIPVGVLEDHGPHLPLNTDLLEAEFLCSALVERIEPRFQDWHWVLAPSFASAVDSATSDLALTSRAHVIRDYLVDTCQALARNGFCYFAVISGTSGPKQIVAIEDASRLLKKLNAGGPISSAFRKFFRRAEVLPTLFCPSIALIEREEVMRSPITYAPLEHGGKTDTSVLLALASSAVSPTYSTLPNQESSDSTFESWMKRLRHQTHGYRGNPSQASAELGRQELTRKLDAMATKTEAVLRGEKPEWVLRSWYSAFPPNRSFFKSWLLAIGIGVIMAAWVLMTIRWSMT